MQSAELQGQILVLVRCPRQTGAPRAWLRAGLVCPQPLRCATMRVPTSTHATRCQSPPNSVTQPQVCGVLAASLAVPLSLAPVLPELPVCDARRRWERLKDVAEGLGCWRHLGCPGLSFILRGQLEAAEKQSLHFQGPSDCFI